jgi:hypothetical protein
MSAFAVVRDTAELTLACDNLSALLALRLRQNPGSGLESLLGVWVDPGLAEEIPPVMTLPDSMPLHQLRIRESTGFSAIWTLCWCDLLGAAAGERVSRDALLMALRAASQYEQQESAPRGVFIPVFRTDAEAFQVRAEMDRLRDLHPGCVMPPLYQDPATGRLSPPYRH